MWIDMLHKRYKSDWNWRADNIEISSRVRFSWKSNFPTTAAQSDRRQMLSNQNELEIESYRVCVRVAAYVNLSTGLLNNQQINKLILDDWVSDGLFK